MIHARRTGLTVVMLGVLVALLGAWPAQAEKKVLRLRIDGPMMEAPSDAAGLMALLEHEQFATLHEWVTMVRAAARDSKIDGLVLIIQSPEINLAQVEEMCRALQEFRATGKPVYCYADFVANLSYALASAADHLTIAENSELFITGLGAELMFFKSMFDKIGVEFDGMRSGAYKSALEPFTRTEPTPENAAMINWLLDGLYERWIALIAQNRGLAPDDVRRLVDQAPLASDDALKAKLVDAVSGFPEFRQRILKEFGSDVKIAKKYEEQAGEKIDMNNPFAMFQVFSRIMEGVSELGEDAEPGVALIYIDGMIIVGPSDDGGFGGPIAGSDTVRAALEEARESEHVKAVVLRVDSPGGSATASDIIWKAATDLSEEKPLIVSMGGVAGSGGYYVSIPGDVIFAEDTTLTGSIGVLGGKLVWNELMENKIGITSTQFYRGAHAGLMSPSHKWDESERAWMRSFLDRVYAQFKGRIMSSRGAALQGDLEEMAGGRVYTGRQALERGLVDRIGGLADALALARERASLPKDCEVYLIPRPSELRQLVSFFEQIFGEDDRDDFEIQPRAHLVSSPLLRAALPLLGELAPEQLREVARVLQGLLLIQREHVGCFMPAVPIVR